MQLTQTLLTCTPALQMLCRYGYSALEKNHCQCTGRHRHQIYACRDIMFYCKALLYHNKYMVNLPCDCDITVILLCVVLAWEVSPITGKGGEIMCVFGSPRHLEKVVSDIVKRCIQYMPFLFADIKRAEDAPAPVDHLAPQFHKHNLS